MSQEGPTPAAPREQDSGEALRSDILGTMRQLSPFSVPSVALSYSISEFMVPCSGRLTEEHVPAEHCLKPWRRHSFLPRILPTNLGTNSTGRGRAGLWGCTRVYGARVKQLSDQKHTLGPPAEDRGCDHLPPVSLPPLSQETLIVGGILNFSAANCMLAQLLC
jgi:hypothetical protein